MNRLLKNKNRLSRIALAVLAPMILTFSFVAPVYAGRTCGGGKDSAGNAYPTVNTTIDLGCTGKGNPITDMLFAFIRLLSDGVGIVVIASVIIGGIQYSTARSDPQAAAAATKRLSSAIIALFVFIFAYAILNFVIPGGFFNGS